MKTLNSYFRLLGTIFVAILSVALTQKSFAVNFDDPGNFQTPAPQASFCNYEAGTGARFSLMRGQGNFKSLNDDLLHIYAGQTVFLHFRNEASSQITEFISRIDDARFEGSTYQSVNAEAFNRGKKPDIDFDPLKKRNKEIVDFHPLIRNEYRPYLPTLTPRGGRISRFFRINSFLGDQVKISEYDLSVIPVENLNHFTPRLLQTVEGKVIQQTLPGFDNIKEPATFTLLTENGDHIEISRRSDNLLGIERTGDTKEIKNWLNPDLVGKRIQYKITKPKGQTSGSRLIEEEPISEGMGVVKSVDMANGEIRFEENSKLLRVTEGYRIQVRSYSLDEPQVFDLRKAYENKVQTNFISVLGSEEFAQVKADSTPTFTPQRHFEWSPFYGKKIRLNWINPLAPSGSRVTVDQLVVNLNMLDGDLSKAYQELLGKRVSPSAMWVLKKPNELIKGSVFSENGAGIESNAFEQKLKQALQSQNLLDPGELSLLIVRGTENQPVQPDELSLLKALISKSSFRPVNVFFTSLAGGEVIYSVRIVPVIGN